MPNSLKITLGIIARVALLILLAILAAQTSSPAHQLLIDVFNYDKPAGFAGYSFSDSVLAWDLTFLFWSSFVFGAMGKKTDYVFIVLVTIFTIWSFVGTDNVTMPMYLALIGVAVVGNLIGYGLKLARLRWYPSAR